MLPGREGNVMSSFWTAFALGFAITGIAHLALWDASSRDEPMTPGAVILDHGNGCRAFDAQALIPVADDVGRVVAQRRPEHALSPTRS